MRSASLACTRRKITRGLPGRRTADQRLLEAGAKAADAGEDNVEAAALDGFIERVKDLFSAVAATACSHADGDARNGGRELGEPGFTDRVECANILNANWCAALLPPLGERFDFALQSALVHVAEDVVVDLDHRRQGALAEAGNGADGEATVGRGESQLVGLAVFVGLTIAEPRSRQSLSSRSREPRVWQAVPRHTQITLSPCGSRLNSAKKVAAL